MPENIKRVNIEIGWDTFWRVLIFISIILLFYIARQALGVLFTAIVISLGIDPAVSFFEKKGVNRLLGTLMIFIAGAIVLATAFYFIIPITIIQAEDFFSQLNQIISSFLGFGIPETAIKAFSLNLNKVLSFVTPVSGSITGTLSTVLTNVVLVLSTIVISFYLSVEKNGTERLLKVILPNTYESSVLQVFGKFRNKMRIWLVTQIGLSLVVGAVVTIGLLLLGVKYAITLGIIAAILELVPVIGPILSGIIAFLIAVSESFMLGIYVVIFFFIVQQLENNVFIPIIMKKAMGIHPVIALIALLTGARAAGLAGIILSVPIALLAQEIFNYLAEKKDHKPAA